MFVPLGITTVLTLSTIGLDSRNDLPKVKYATALDWFLLMSFFYCIATLLEFAGVHYFTKVGSGEIPVDEEDWEDVEVTEGLGDIPSPLPIDIEQQLKARRRSSLICPIYNDPSLCNSPKRLSLTTHTAPPNRMRIHSQQITMERHTQTETKVPKWRQLYFCLVGDERYRRERQREAARSSMNKRVNSVSHIDRAARVLFPMSFLLLNVAYWLLFFKSRPEFAWKELITGL